MNSRKRVIPDENGSTGTIIHRKRKGVQKDGTEQADKCKVPPKEGPVTKNQRPFGQLLKSTVFPKEHANCPFCDSRVYIPTVRDFITDTEQGSMLEEGDLRNVAKHHVLLNLSEEFLVPSVISKYIKRILRRTVFGKSSWSFNMVESETAEERNSPTSHLAGGRSMVDERLRLAAKRHLSAQFFEDMQEQAKLTFKDVKQLLESLLANMLRFLVLYCVHGLRDQVFTKLSSTGEVMYKLRYPAKKNIAKKVAESDE
ncbi:hypothetical protein OSTOST_15095, partial [Ostertagia ostertagi]